MSKRIKYEMIIIMISGRETDSQTFEMKQGNGDGSDELRVWHFENLNDIVLFQ